MKFQANDGRSNDPNMDVLKVMTLKVICWKKPNSDGHKDLNRDFDIYFF